jgi:hypothetical protein
VLPSFPQIGDQTQGAFSAFGCVAAGAPGFAAGAAGFVADAAGFATGAAGFATGTAGFVAGSTKRWYLHQSRENR